jgi:hypothetical protein
MSNLTTTQDEINADITDVLLNGEIVADILDEHGVIASRGRYAARCNGAVSFHATQDEALVAVRNLLGLGAEPEWRTLKGVATPFQVLVTDTKRLIPTRDRRTPTGVPVTVARVEKAGGCATGYTADGRRVSFNGNATRMWVIAEAA